MTARNSPSELLSLVGEAGFFDSKCSLPPTFTTVSSGGYAEGPQNVGKSLCSGFHLLRWRL